MYAGYIYPLRGTATLNLTNMPAGVYDFYIYGPDGIYDVSAGSQDFGSKATANAATVNPIVWQEGVQYIVIRGVPLTAGQAATITVRPGASGYATISGFQVLSVSGTPPAITTQPANASAAVGSNATFTVTASGTAPLVYRWRFNGTDMNAANSSALNLSSVQTNQAGNYSVAIRNGYGAVTSLDATLTVYRLNHAPSATPQSIIVNYDQSATVALLGSDPDGDALTYSVA